MSVSRAAVIHLNFRAGSTFPVPVCTVSPGHWDIQQTLNRTSRCDKVDTVSLEVEFTITKGAKGRGFTKHDVSMGDLKVVFHL